MSSTITIISREYAGSRLHWPHHDSKVVLPDSNKCSHMVIIGEKDQILPCAVLHLSTSLPTIPTLIPYAASFPSQHNALTIPPVFVSNIIPTSPLQQFLLPMTTPPPSLQAVLVPKVHQPSGNQVTVPRLPLRMLRPFVPLPTNQGSLNYAYSFGNTSGPNQLLGQ